MKRTKSLGYKTSPDEKVTFSTGVPRIIQIGILDKIGGKSDENLIVNDEKIDAKTRARAMQIMQAISPELLELIKALLFHKLFPAEPHEKINKNKFYRQLQDEVGLKVFQGELDMETLLEVLGPLITHMICVKLKIKSRQDVEDAKQIACLAAYDALRTFNPELGTFSQHYSTWLKSIIIRSLLSQNRTIINKNHVSFRIGRLHDIGYNRQQIRKLLLVENDYDLPQDLVDNEIQDYEESLSVPLNRAAFNTPDDTDLEEEYFEEEAIREIFGNFSGTEMTMLTKYYFEGKTNKKIGTEYNLSRERIRQLIEKLRAQMLRHLTKEKSARDLQLEEIAT